MFSGIHDESGGPSIFDTNIKIKSLNSATEFHIKNFSPATKPHQQESDLEYTPCPVDRKRGTLNAKTIKQLKLCRERKIGLLHHYEGIACQLKESLQLTTTQIELKKNSLLNELELLCKHETEKSKATHALKEQSIGSAKQKVYNDILELDRLVSQKRPGSRLQELLTRVPEEFPCEWVSIPFSFPYKISRTVPSQPCVSQQVALHTPESYPLYSKRHLISISQLTTASELLCLYSSHTQDSTHYSLAYKSSSSSQPRWISSHSPVLSKSRPNSTKFYLIKQ